jgi:hypothetical protein
MVIIVQQVLAVLASQVALVVQQCYTQVEEVVVHMLALRKVELLGLMVEDKVLHPEVITKLLVQQIKVEAAVVHMMDQELLVVLVLSLLAIPVLNVVQVELLRQSVETLSIPLHLQEHLQHDTFC